MHVVMAGFTEDSADNSGGNVNNRSDTVLLGERSFIFRILLTMAIVMAATITVIVILQSVPSSF